MALLESFRKGTDSTSTRLFIGAVLLVFVLWGGGSSAKNAGNSSVVAEVNGVSITKSDFDRKYRQMMQQAGGRLEGEAAEQMAAAAKQSLIQEEVLVQTAEARGLTVSGQEISRYVTKIEGFQDEDKKFSEKKYSTALKRNSITAAQFENTVYRQLLSQKLVDLVTRGVLLTDAEIKEEWMHRGTEVSLSYIRLSPGSLMDKIVVDDAEKASWIAANEPKIKAAYDADFERVYNLPKRYQLSLILLRSDVPGTQEAELARRAEEVRALAAGGADFGDLARRYSEDLTAESGGTLGLRPGAQLDPAETTAADAAGVSGVTTVVKTTRGLEILKVEKIEEARVVPLEEVRDTLALRLIRAEKVDPLVASLSQSLIAAWSQHPDGPSPETLSPYALVVETTEPFSLSAETIPVFRDNAALRTWLSTAEVGAVNPGLVSTPGVQMVVAVRTRTPPDEAAYTMQSEMLRLQLLNQRKAEFFQRWLDGEVAKVKIGS